MHHEWKSRQPAPKRVRKAKTPDVSETQAGPHAEQAFHANWSGLPEELIPKIGVFLNKQEVMRLRCVNYSFRIGIDDAKAFKRPLKKYIHC